ETADEELRHAQIPHHENLDQFFEREFVRSLFTLAVQDLRAHCRASGKLVQFAIFERYDLNPSENDRASYADLAREFSIPVPQVTNFLAFARSEFRRYVLGRLRRTTGSDTEFRSEARRLFGVNR